MQRSASRAACAHPHHDQPLTGLKIQRTQTDKAPLIIAVLLPSALFAQETRDLGAHEHGHSALDIAIEGTQVTMDLEAPGPDIAGFEYEAATAEDRAKLDAAIKTLSDPLSLFVPPAAADCTVVEASADLMDEHHEHRADHTEDEHADEEGAAHAEFHAEYLLSCTDPTAIDRVGFAFFETFPNAEEVEVQMISDKSSRSSATRPFLDLSGLNLSRLRAAPSARSSRFSFEGVRAFPA
ncbi:DUF2796 domain-containing protein [Salipiger aestuarii]|uniref:DUF2796 domain-containing protein n=1 Tax=Salipiger aestuarii TaxID=568098 RepID=UPI001F117F85|nr:DUF2796 domain-containing protein [Salipiger aestuarii]